MSNLYPNPNRTEVRKMRCPKCGTEPGEPCQYYDKVKEKYFERAANHQERMNAYRVKYMDGVGVIIRGEPEVGPSDRVIVIKRRKINLS